MAALWASRVSEQRMADSSDRMGRVTLLGNSSIQFRASWMSASFTRLVLLSRLLVRSTSLWRRAGKGHAVLGSGHAEVKRRFPVTVEVSLLLERVVASFLQYITRQFLELPFLCTVCVSPSIASGVTSVRLTLPASVPASSGLTLTPRSLSHVSVSMFVLGSCHLESPLSSRRMT